MASLRVLAFDHEGRPVQFDTWLDDLQLYLLSDSKDSVSLFDLVSGAAIAPPATADSSTRSQTAQALYDAVVARYSSPATAALGRLFLPYLFPELSAFATVEDMVSHLCASDARYCAAVPADFLDRNPPPMYITRLPESLRSVRDHFLSLDPTSLTIDLLEQHLLTAETSAIAVGAARGTPRPPFFEWCSPSTLAPSYASAAAADISVPEDAGAASASAKSRSSKGRGGRGGGGGSGSGGGGSRSGGGGSNGGGSGGGTVGGSGGSGGGGGGSGGSGGSGGGGTGSGGIGARRGRFWGWPASAAAASERDPVSPAASRVVSAWGVRGWLPICHSHGIAIFDLDFDAILSAMYALSVSAEGECYRCVPPDPGIAAAALGASASGTPPGTAPAEALHTFTLDSGASRFPPRSSRVRQFRPARCQVFTSPRSLRTWSGSRLLLVSPPVAPDSSVTPPSGSPLPTSPSWHALSSTCLWPPQVPAFPAALPSVEGRQRVAPHSSSFPPTTAPVQTCYRCGSHGECFDDGGGSGSGGGGGGGGGAGRGAAAQRGGFGGSQRQQQLRSRETPLVQQLREWYAGRGRSGGAGPCTYAFRTDSRRGETCGLPHTTPRCFGRLTDAWRAQFPDAVELPRWHDLLLQNVPIFDLDFDAILAAMYAFADSAEGECYLSVPPDPGIAAAALGASASTAPGTGVSAAPGACASALFGTAPAEALHTFTLDSGASRSFFRDSTTLSPRSRPVAVSLADPSGGPVLAHYSTVLPCPAAPLGLLSGLHLPSFSTNLVSGADLQDAWVDQFTPGGQCVIHCTCSRTGRHLATFTRRPGSSLYTLTTAPPSVSASGQVAASSQVFAATSRSSPTSAPFSCRPLSHETLLRHHRLGHPSLPRLRGMASRALVSGLPRSLPPLPPGPAPTCVPCVEGQQRAAPHSSSFPATEAPLQTLHMDVCNSTRIRGQGHERYFLLVVDDYSRYTTVFPLHSKDRGGEFSSDLLRAFCRSEGIRQTFTLPASPQQNGIAERRIGMVIDVARTSMIHAAAPHFLWPFAVQYAAHQINLQPRVSLPETTPTLRWTGKVGDASAFRVWGSRAFVRDTTADKLSSRVVPFVFLGFPPDAPGWQFYHPTSRRVLSSKDVTFDELECYYCVFPYRTASLPPPRRSSSHQVLSR
ncbi:unnamed protein product [Closterium sp. NIES-53]